MFKSSITDIFTSEADAYRYGGKEFDRFAGLDLHDFSVRWYDQQLCRFTTPDPLQEKYPHLSPYLYCAANPLRYTDPPELKFESKKTMCACHKLVNLGIPNQMYLLCLCDKLRTFRHLGISN